MLSGAASTITASRNVWFARERGTRTRRRRALVSEDQDSDDLRQSSPFAGMLSEPERRRTLQLG
jgi:hypothetical protein